VVVAFIDDHRERFGVEPICRLLCEHGAKVAPNSYYAHRKRPASARAERDEQVLPRSERCMLIPPAAAGSTESARSMPSSPAKAVSTAGRCPAGWWNG
jgi:putative transposase